MTELSNVVVEICVALDGSKYIEYIDTSPDEFDKLREKFSSESKMVRYIGKFEIIALMGLKLPLRDVMRLKVYKFQIATEDQVPEGFFISGNT